MLGGSSIDFGQAKMTKSNPKMFSVYNNLGIEPPQGGVENEIPPISYSPIIPLKDTNYLFVD